MPHGTGFPTLDELQGLPDEELRVRADKHLANAHQPVQREMFIVYRDELQRREQNRTEDVMLAYTKQMRNMTIVILVATILSLFAVAVSMFR